MTALFHMDCFFCIEIFWNQIIMLLNAILKIYVEELLCWVKVPLVVIWKGLSV